MKKHIIEWFSGVPNPTATIVANHIARVQADGGVIDDVDLLRSTIQTLVANYGIRSEAEFKTKIPVSIYPSVFGYKVGAGSGGALGFAASKLYSVNENADVAQATAANQPLLLVHSGRNYYYHPRVSASDYPETDTSLVTSWTSGVDTLRLTMEIFGQKVTSGGYDDLVNVAGNFRFQIQSFTTGFRLRFRSGATLSTASNLFNPTSTDSFFIRVSLTPTAIDYEWSEDGVSYSSAGSVALIAYAGGLGTNIKYLNTAIGTGNAVKLYYATFQNVTLGTISTFDPSEFNRTYSDTFWEGTNCSWTLRESTATTGQKARLCDSTIAQGDGIAQKITNSSLVIAQPYTAYLSVRQLGTGVFYGLQASSQLSNNATNTTLNNGTALNLADTLKTTKLITAVSNGSNSELYLNNATSATGNAGANDGTYLEIFGNGASYGNFTLNYLLIVNGN